MNPTNEVVDTLKPCSFCPFKARTANQHVLHQQIHANTNNFRFVCPFPRCDYVNLRFDSISSHLSNHSTNRDQVIGDVSTFKCQYCDCELQHSNALYARHLKTHIGDGFAVECPFRDDPNCSRKGTFSSQGVFSSHLSQCHPGWKTDFITSALPSFYEQCTGRVDHDLNETRPDMDATYEEMDQSYGDNNQVLPPGLDGTRTSDGSSRSSFDFLYGNSLFSHDQIVRHLAHFYALLEGKLLVPESTVDVIAQQLSFISGVLQDNLKVDLTRALGQAGLSDETISDVIKGVITLDPLYNAHHMNAPGVCLLTSDRRHTYFKRNFKYQSAIQINLCLNPTDTSHYMHYVSLKETIEILLQDPTVQREIDESFLVPPSDGSVLRNYKDGSVYTNSNCPLKCIDLILFMDGFNCTEPLGPAKKKHKMHGMYMVLGNLKPFMRAYLKAIRLIALINDLSLKGSERMYKKCFDRITRDLKDLEENGISYKGEIVPVRLQFITGDNLGQHTLGGLVESFSAYHFCRYCDIHKLIFEEDKSKDRTFFRQGEMRTPSSERQNLRAKIRENVDNFKGVKRDSPFHKLKYFNCFEPRLSPCIFHDLFIDGVVDNDVQHMLKYFIDKNWFTEHWLQMTIKRFKYEGKDARNKPHSFEYGKKKFVGHAVQNWTLFRLLPIIIGDKVKNTRNKVWKLYLLLKSIVELICAPALTRDQVEEMRELINKYMQKRKILPNRCKPKHHFFSHHPDLYLLFGPLIHLSTLQFEHRHQYFKRVSRLCRNFINLGFTLSSKFQYLQAYQNMGPLFPEEPIYFESSLVSLDEKPADLKEFLLICHFSPDAATVKKVSVSDVTYKVGQWLLLGNSLEENTIYAAEIELIVCDGTSCQAIVRQHEAELWQEFGLYYVTIKEPVLSAVPLSGTHENPVPHPVYIFQERYCFSLKHVMLNTN